MKLSLKRKNQLLNQLQMDQLFGFEYTNSIDIQQLRKDIDSLPKNIEELSEYISNCSLCELSKFKISCPSGKGNPLSKIVLISLNRDYKNEKEYNEIKQLFENKFNINDIYMTNVLKCISSRTKDNSENASDKCIQYLEQQLNIIEPELIITFGKAFNHLMKSNDNIIDISGNLFRYNASNVIPLLDMDFINKNPSYKDKMDSDLEKIKIIMDKK